MEVPGLGRQLGSSGWGAHGRRGRAEVYMGRKREAWHGVEWRHSRIPLIACFVCTSCSESGVGASERGRSCVCLALALGDGREDAGLEDEAKEAGACRRGGANKLGGARSRVI